MSTQKGQAGAIFKLLIGAIIGLAIFGIIYSLIVQTENQKAYLDNTIFVKKLKMAIKNPTGSEYQLTESTIKGGTVINQKFLSLISGLKETCFKLKSERTGVKKTKNSLVFDKDLKTKFSILCEIGDDDDCQINCTITAK